jgi:hypothetical protein
MMMLLRLCLLSRVANPVGGILRTQVFINAVQCYSQCPKALHREHGLFGVVSGGRMELDCYAVNECQVSSLHLLQHLEL